ncbi:MAG: acetate--CoA ligase family protein [Actinomycetota bacterium]|nr:acetate--CoA ligase family protein [Actinomycetota bacterium]
MAEAARRPGGALNPFFAPRAVAVVGAGREPEKVGRVIFDNLLAAFGGPIYPVNPKAAEIEGHRCFPSIADIPGPVDLIVVAVPGRQVAGVIEDAGRRGVKAAIVISAGFKETGVEGARLEDELAKTAESYGMRLLGPNCLGLMDTSTGLNVSFAGALPRAGGIAFMSQSGALCTAILDWAKGAEVGFSKFVSLGNKADISEIDLLPVLADDPRTTVITTYLEGIKDGRGFMAAAAYASARKPVIVLKAGTTNAGARAVSSHTGTLAGSENVYNAAFRQSGVIRANTVEDIFDFAVGFSSQPLPKGRRLAIVTNAGGPGIMAADAVERQGMWLADFQPATVETLRAGLPAEANVYNPVDVLGDALADRYDRAIAAVLKDPHVDSAIVLLTPQAMTEIVQTAKELIKQARQAKAKPVFTCFMGQAEVGKGIKVLRQAGIPNFSFPERAVAIVRTMVDYTENRTGPTEEIPRFPVDRSRVEAAINESGKHRNLIDAQALGVVEAYGIKVPRTELAHTAREALDIAAELKYPVVLKAVAPELLHKSDIGAIAAGIANDFELRRAYREILSNVDRFMPDAELWGVTVQEMVRGGSEVILGMNDDPQFGPLLMFGLGGIYVEVLKDVSFRLAPITPAEAKEMVEEIRSYPLLQGVRGGARADIEAIVDALLRLSQLVVDWPQIQELDINPLLVLPAGQGAVAADVRIMMSEG